MKQARQKNWVIHQLYLYGSVSRNKALENYISRLGALIGVLKKEGWKFSAGYEQGKFGRDYVYRVLDRDIRQVLTTLPPAFKPKPLEEEETNLKLL